MRRAVLLFLICGFSVLATAQLPKTNRMLAFVDLTDSANPKTELVFVKPDGVNFRAPLEEMTKQLQAGNRLVPIEEINGMLDETRAQYDTLLKHDNDVVAKYNALVEQYNQLAAKAARKAQQQQALAFWLATQQNRPSPTQPMEDFLRRQQEKQIHCESSTAGTITTTDCR